MLTYQQFLQKHAVKYRGLSAAEKRKRYADYSRVAGGSVVNSAPTAPNRRRRTRRQRRQGQGAPIVASLASSASGEAKFLALYANPFDSDFNGLPVFPSPPSAKFSAWARGVAAVGTNGVGFVLGSPVTTSDSNAVYFSGTPYAGTTFSSVTGTGVSAASPQNVPIASGGLTAETTGMRARVALAALRVRYIGTEQNRGGAMYPYVSPLHQDLNTKDLTWIASQEDFRSVQVDRGWVTVVWTPVFRTECDYYHTPGPPTHNSLDTPAYTCPFGVLFSGTPGNSFEWQYIIHIEYAGPSTPWLTKTESAITVNFSEVIDKFQTPRYALRGSGGATMRDLRPLMDAVMPMLKQAGVGVGRYVLASALRDEL